MGLLQLASAPRTDTAVIFLFTQPVQIGIVKATSRIERFGIALTCMHLRSLNILGPPSGVLSRLQPATDHAGACTSPFSAPTVIFQMHVDLAARVLDRPEMNPQERIAGRMNYQPLQSLDRFPFHYCYHGSIFIYYYERGSRQF